MSNDLEGHVISILPMFEDQFKEMASLEFNAKVLGIKFISCKTQRTRGTGGTLLISDVTVGALLARSNPRKLTKKIAIKFAIDAKSSIKEIKNSFILETKYTSYPEFGTPRVLFASTLEPHIILYEGVSGFNYDECDFIPSKPYYAGKLLAILHGKDLKPIEEKLYLQYARNVIQRFDEIGLEQEISSNMIDAYNKLVNSMGGSMIHSDFHQSNVMLDIAEDMQTVHKVYIIDPEWMSGTNMDRMEDVGIFFGAQLLAEFAETSTVLSSLQDLILFLKGYNEYLMDGQSGISLQMMYPNGISLKFHIALWALLDALDFVITRTEGNSLLHPEVMTRIQFALHILNHPGLNQISQLRFL